MESARPVFFDEGIAVMSVSTRCRAGAALAIVLTMAISACGSDRGANSQRSGSTSSQATEITDIVRGKLAELDLSAAVFGVCRTAAT
jgi:D-alanyl-D-alanine carboxypeptidase